jgi:transcription elongation factor Elf1
MSGLICPAAGSTERVKIGITCPDCGAKTRVYYTRPVEGGKVQRVRICNKCERRITTHELVVGFGKRDQGIGRRKWNQR